MTARALLEGSRRLHPMSVPVRIGARAMKLIIPIILVVWLSEGSKWELYVPLFVIPLAIFETYVYFTTRFRLTPGELVVTRGLLFRNERHIPFARIQNIDLVQNPIERMLSLAEVRVETASGKEPEAILRDLSLATVDALRERIFGEAAEELEAAAETPPRPDAEKQDAASTRRDGAGPPRRAPLLQLATRDLIVMGLTSLRGAAFVGVLIGAAWEFDLFDRFEVVERLEAWWDTVDSQKALVAAPLVGLVGFVVLLLLSVVWTIVRLHGFRLERIGDDLRIECGLLTRRTATIPRRRIQFFSMRQSLPQRWLRRVSMRIETAGGTGEKEEDAVSRRWFVPWLPEERAAEMIQAVQPAFVMEPEAWRPLAPKARRRMVRKAFVVSLLIAAAIAIFLRPWGAIALLVLPAVAIWGAVIEARYTAFGATPDGVVFRSGAWTRRISTTIFEKMQVVSMRETPFDRRWRMASVRVDTAGAGPAAHQIAIPYLPRDVAAALRRELAERSGAVTFRWR